MKTRKILFFIILISLIFQIVFSILDKIPDTDECFYMSFAQGILKNKIPSFPNGEPYLIHPPLFSYLLAIFFKIFGVHLYIGRFLSSIASFVVIIFTFLIANEIKNSKIASWSTFLLAINPFFLYYSHTVYQEMTLTAFLSSSFYYFLIAERTKNNKYFFLSGILLGLALITKYTAMILLASVLIYWIFKFKKNIILKKETYLFILPVVFFFFCWIVFALLVNKKALIQQQLFLISYFKVNSWHLSTWRTVSFPFYLKELCGVITPFFIFVFIIVYFWEIIKIFKTKKIYSHPMDFLTIFLFLYIIGLIKIRFKDIHFAIPIMGILSIYAAYGIFFLNNKLKLKRIIKTILIVFFVWSVSPATLLFDPLTKKIYDNVYIYGIKRDKNYQAYRVIGRYLKNYVKDKEKIYVEGKKTIINYYLEKKVILYDGYYLPFEIIKEIIKDCNIIVKEEGISNLTVAEEKKIKEYIQKNFYLKKTFQFKYIPLAFITDYKILPPDKREKTFWIYFRKN